MFTNDEDENHTVPENTKDEMNCTNMKILSDSFLYKVPEQGTVLDRRRFRKAGKYTIGPAVDGYQPVSCMVQYLARKDNTDSFYQLKIIQLNRYNETQEERQGKALIHAEYSVLSILRDVEGVIQCHEMFSDLAFVEGFTTEKRLVYTGSLTRRIVLVLDCLVQHPFSDKSASYINLQEHVMGGQKLSESEALFILYEIVKVVEIMHKKNVIHRDLKLGNIVLNKISKKIILTNFGLGQYLSNDNTLITDQKGSPAYMSPDILSFKPYKGKPSDMWALGICFYIMLFGNFPFFKSRVTELFQQIIEGDYEIPQDTDISKRSIDVIKGLLNANVEQRLTAHQLRLQLELMLALNQIASPDQCVPFKKTNFKYTISFNNNFFKTDHVVPGVEQNRENISNVSPSTSLRKGLKDNSIVRSRNRNRTIASLIRSTPTENVLRIITNGMQQIRNFRRSEIIEHQNNLSTMNVGNQLLFRRDNTTESMVQSFIASLDRYFIAGRMTPPSNTPLIEFDGCLSSTMTTNLYHWLETNFNENELIRTVLLRPDEPIRDNVKKLLISCGVRIEDTPFGMRMLQQQSNSVIIFLTYLLQVTGFNNSYFITQLDDTTDD